MNIDEQWLRLNYPDADRVIAEYRRMLRDDRGPLAVAGPSVGQRGKGAGGSTATAHGEPTLIGVESGPGWWTVRLADWKPVSDNLRARGIWAWHRGKSRDREVIRRLVVEDAGVPLASGRRKVSLVVEKRDRRGMFDTPNILKSFNDSLKTCGLIVDDSDEWLDWCKPVIVVKRDLKYRLISCIQIEDCVS